MSLSERRREFEAAARADPLVSTRTKFHRLFGVSNSAKVIGGGLQLGVVNLDNVAADADGFAFACTIVFPPADEVYFAAYVKSGAQAMSERLTAMKLAGAADPAAPADVDESDHLTFAARNNNVVVVLADDGRLYLRNQGFWDTLPASRDAIGPGIEIDRINVALFPPAASVQRSLLAREFIGYLGRFAGREKIHELQVWESASSVGSLMRRMPETIEPAEIHKRIAELGGVFPDALVDRFHAALNHLPDKHFVILPGLSGTGKTLLARLYAYAVHGLTSVDQADPLTFICPVRPEWTDPTGLTGHYDVLSDRYVVPPFLEALLLATAYRDSPVFVILDEMNLARVEYYLSDVLSAIESHHPLQLHSSGIPLEGSTGGEVPGRLPVAPNLFIVGTVNVDETTNALSDKVLDRAVVIDMSEVDLPTFFSRLEQQEPALATAIEQCAPLLMEISALMHPQGLGFGYRLAGEFLRYHRFAVERLGRSPAEVLDDQLVQKALVKLRGGEAERKMLNGLRAALAGYPQASAALTKLANDLDDIGSFQAAR